MNITRGIQATGALTVRTVLIIAILSCLVFIGVASWLLTNFGREALSALTDGSAFYSAGRLYLAVLSLSGSLVSLLVLMATAVFGWTKTGKMFFWLFAVLLCVSSLAGSAFIVDWLMNGNGCHLSCFGRPQ